MADVTIYTNYWLYGLKGLSGVYRYELFRSMEKRSWGERLHEHGFLMYGHAVACPLDSRTRIARIKLIIAP